MHPIVRNILAVIAGVFLGSVVNMGLVQLGPSIIPMPEGYTPEKIVEFVSLFEPKHFIFPFLAHALGTLVGAYVAARIAVTHKMKFALGIGFFFLLGGIAVNIMLADAPLWFKLLDQIVAYIPTGILGGWLATIKQQ